MSPTTVSTNLAQIAEQSKRAATVVFTTLAHLMDEDFLTEAFYQLRKDAAAGIDEMTATEYAVNLRERIADLVRSKLSCGLSVVKPQQASQPLSGPDFAS